jgi:hypothetical protein
MIGNKGVKVTVTYKKTRTSFHIHTALPIGSKTAE